MSKSDIKPVIVLTHASFDEARHLSMMGVMSDLRIEAPGLPIILVDDWNRKGALWCWLESCKRALEAPGNFTHIVRVPDDCIICKDYGAILKACIEARPDAIWDGFQNHSLFRTHEVDTCWTSVSNGYTGMGGVIPRAKLEEILAWRDELTELHEYPDDALVDLWCMWMGERIYKTAWTLVQHNDKMPSLVGNDNQQKDGIERVGLRPVAQARRGVQEDYKNFLGRTYMAPEEHMPGRKTSCIDLGTTYKSNMFDLVRKLPPEFWRLDEMYRACHELPQTKEHVVLIVPVYRESEEIMRQTNPSRQRIAEMLEAQGIACTIMTPHSDSHVDRMRQRATHQALKLGATWLLWCDADIECITPECVQTMMRSGHDIIAGACPFKDGSGKVVCNLLPETERILGGGEGTLDLKGGCLEVQDAGTGFLLMKREAVLKLFQEHHDMVHLSRADECLGEPLWAIWDACLVGAEGKTWEQTLFSRCFLTEDYMLGELWRAIGGKVYVYVLAKFRHWGNHGFSGSFEEEYGLKRC